MTRRLSSDENRSEVRAEAIAFSFGPLHRLAFFADLAHVSESYVNPANDPGALLPSRTRIGLGVSAHVWEGRLRIDVAVRDALDQRGIDLLGFPLPGRALSVALSIHSD